MTDIGLGKGFEVGHLVGSGEKAQSVVLFKIVLVLRSVELLAIPFPLPSCPLSHPIVDGSCSHNTRHACRLSAARNLKETLYSPTIARISNIEPINA